MARKLDRYILTEVVASWLIVTGVLLVVLLTNQVARVLERAAENQFPRQVVLELVGLGALQNLSVLLPVGLLLGVVLAFGRLYHESEMAAAQACGVGPSRIYLPVTALALLVTALVAWLTMGLAPAATARTLELRDEALRSGQFAPIVAGKFRTFGGGGTVVYAQDAEPDGTLGRVFVRRERGARLEVALAQRARHEVSDNGMLHTITLYDGERHEGVPGSPQYRIVRFAEHVIPLRVPDPSAGSPSLETVPTQALLSSRDLEARAEFHWRLALPLMTIVLTLIGMPLSRLRPRQGRFARVWLAILIYFVYSNLASAGKVWIARGVLPEALGLWWVHGVVALFAAAIVLVPRWLARRRHVDVLPALVPAPAAWGAG